MATFLMRHRLSRFVALSALAIVLTVGFAAGLGYTAVRANGNGTVEACVNKYTGGVRMNQGNMPLNCTSNEIKRTWDGNDSAGLTDVQFITSEEYLDSPTSYGLTATCLPGQQLIGGGARLDNNTYQLVSSFPDDQTNRWIASTVTSGVPSPVTFTVYAICASYGA